MHVADGSCSEQAVLIKSPSDLTLSRSSPRLGAGNKAFAWLARSFTIEYGAAIVILPSCRRQKLTTTLSGELMADNGVPAAVELGLVLIDVWLHSYPFAALQRLTLRRLTLLQTRL